MRFKKDKVEIDEIKNRDLMNSYANAQSLHTWALSDLDKSCGHRNLLFPFLEYN